MAQQQLFAGEQGLAVNKGLDSLGQGKGSL